MTYRVRRRGDRREAPAGSAGLLTRLPRAGVDIVVGRGAKDVLGHSQPSTWQRGHLLPDDFQFLDALSDFGGSLGDRRRVGAEWFFCGVASSDVGSMLFTSLSCLLRSLSI
jgi:hypothetical protein